MGLKAVILAAGRGERLSPKTDEVPKPLLPLGGKPLTMHLLLRLAEAGVKEFIIVVGYLGEVVRRGLSSVKDLGIDVRWVVNPNYLLGNAYSLLCAERSLLKDYFFLLSMSDHLFEGFIINNILNEFDGEPLISVDRDPRYLLDVREATKVKICERGYVRDIGKEISDWDAVDMGLFILDKSIFRVIREFKGKPAPLSRCMKRWIDETGLRACESTGRLWLDVDTPEDLERAEMMMESWT
ncbi:NTP transferase domain-containing protein [Candidatus Bathyarchaeota archaeon]|nr:NTP transferase domain-containing protein [Candidatus Bathyarchaeota archaeon]